MKTLTITQPKHCILQSPDTNPIVKTTVGRATTATILDSIVTYHVQDQFKKFIELSEWGNAHPKHQETVPWKSDFPEVAKWASTIEVGGTNWFLTRADGRFSDQLQLLNFPLKDFKFPKGGFFDPAFLNREVLALNTHVWKMSVDEISPQIVASNTLHVIITKVDPTEITLNAVYTIATQ